MNDVVPSIAWWVTKFKTMKVMPGIGSYFLTNLKVVVLTFDGVRYMAAASLRVMISSRSFSSGAHPSGGIRFITLNMFVWLGDGLASLGFLDSSHL